MRTGESVLEFGQLGSGDPFGGSPDQVYLQYCLGSPFDHWGYRGEALVSDARYTSTSATRTGVSTTSDPFDLTAVALRLSFQNFVKYRSVHAYWSRAGLADRARTLATQHEVLLFARDPEEHFQTLSAIRDQVNVPFTQSFRTEFEASRLPDAASLVYPPQLNWNTNPPLGPTPGPAAVVAKYATANFWRNGVTPAGPGAAPFDPDGPGSVKAVHVINHGLCAKLSAYADSVDANGKVTKPGIFSLVGTKFFTAMETKLAESLDASAVITLDRSNDPPRAQAPGSLDGRTFVKHRYDGKKFSATNCHTAFGQTTCDVVVQ